MGASRRGLLPICKFCIIIILISNQEKYGFLMICAKRIKKSKSKRFQTDHQGLTIASCEISLYIEVTNEIVKIKTGVNLI
jgi:hypothetical protein